MGKIFIWLGLGAVALVALAAGAGPSLQKFAVKGASGIDWIVERVSTFPDGEAFFDVWTSDKSARLLRYAQTGDDKSSRRLVTKPVHSSPTLQAFQAKAESDFLS